MTTGNISSVSDVSNLVTLKGNVSSLADNKGLSFASLMSVVSDGNHNSRTDANVQPQTVSSDITKVLKSDTNSKPSQKTESSQSTQDANTVSKVDDKLKETCSDIRETVKDELDLTDEELDAALAALGITVADLVEPQNVAMLIAEVNNTDVTAILTDETLAGELVTLTTAIEDVVSTAADSMNIPTDEFVTALKTVADRQMKAESDGQNAVDVAAEATETVTDVSDKDNSVKVTVENHTQEGTQSLNEQTKTVNTTQQTSTDADRHGESDGNNNKSAKEFAQNIVQNLNQSVTEAMASGEAAETYNVNTADIMEQMLEAVRVNVTPETSAMEIQLTPEHLGKLNLNVASKNGIITATITAQNESVRAAIENQVIQLKESMNNQGLKVEQVEVTVASHEFNMNYDNQQDPQNMGNGHKNNSSGRFRTDDELVTEDDVTETERQIMEANGSSVSYMA